MNVLQNYRLYLSVVIAISIGIGACTSTGTVTEAVDTVTVDYPQFPNNELLIQPGQLPELMNEPNTVLIDMRAEGFGIGHIPGARFFGGIPALVDTTHPVQHFLVGPEEFQEIMRSMGINNDTRVLIYDEGNGLGASRLFYALSLYGHENASVLNGGFARWTAAGMPISELTTRAAPGNFTASLNEARSCDIRFLTGALDDDNVVILDARTPEEFSGEDKRAERAGHIPGAVNLEWRMFISEDENKGPGFLSPDEIEALLATKGITPDKEVITHCQSNVRGSHAFFTLRLMGYDSVRAYEGSWFEWGNREDTPVNQP
ncbi:MAG: sulfurtransferase [Balneolales bacterium]|nr:sulfurtransferase [Balneolales bacterium]